MKTQHLPEFIEDLPIIQSVLSDKTSRHYAFVDALLPKIFDFQKEYCDFLRGLDGRPVSMVKSNSTLERAWTALESYVLASSYFLGSDNLLFREIRAIMLEISDLTEMRYVFFVPLSVLGTSLKDSACFAALSPDSAVLENAVIETAQGATYFCSGGNYCICDFGTQDEERTCQSYYSSVPANSVSVQLTDSLLFLVELYNQAVLLHRSLTGFGNQSSYPDKFFDVKHHLEHRISRRLNAVYKSPQLLSLSHLVAKSIDDFGYRTFSLSENLPKTTPPVHVLDLPPLTAYQADYESGFLDARVGG